MLLGSLLATSLFAVAMPSFAYVSEADINRFVILCDTNNDGMASKTEVMKCAGEMFDKMDTAKKGMLDKKQAEAFLKALMAGGA